MVKHVQSPVLVVAGSDPSAGAGLQADLKTVAAMGGYACTAVTAITVQDTRFVHHVHPLPAQLVVEQMLACLNDMKIGCIKLGMLATKETVLAVAELLKQWPHIPVVADPVLAGTGGGTLLDQGGYQAFMSNLLPLLTLLTPNLPEAQTLSGLRTETVAEMEQTARHLIALSQTQKNNGTAVLVTGGHLPGNKITDLLVNQQTVQYFHSQRIEEGRGFHGTGCVLASAIATRVAEGKTVEEAVTAGLAFVRKAMEESLSLGQGQQILHL